VTLSGNTHALARAQYDQGAAPPDLPMNRIMLVLKRSANQETALQNLLTEQQVTSSPTFHKWLTPDQFGQQFGPADSDIQAVTSWLASYGFQSIKVSRGRNVIEFSGTAAQVAAGLHTSIHKYVVNGESHWSNASDPQIPAALAPVIAGVASLHNFPKRAASSRSTQRANLTKDSNGKPQITFTDNSHGLAPADFNTIYNIASTMTGAGMTIGVVGRSNIIPQDIVDFYNTFKLTRSLPNIILNGPDPGDLGGGEEAEAVLDATWSGAVAPGATVDLVISESTNAAAGEDLSEFYIIDNNLADVMTESFSVCERAFLQNGVDNLTGPTGMAAFYSGLAEQAAAQGITYTVASGDSGPDGCADPTIVQASGSGASVNILASTPFTVAVGGTKLNDIANPTQYWNATNSANLGSAKSYIPEDVWNESCTVAQCGASLAGLWSSGGGVSIAFPIPSWQSGVAGIPPTATMRLVPDVSMAAAAHDGYVLCLDASCHGNNPGFSILSGTSASAQVFGGVMALVDQKMGGRVGIANFALYKLASPTFETLANCNASAVLPAVPPANTCIFNDVTSGDTNLAIVGETGFSAAPGPGYDEATGLGSVNVTNLVNNWSKAVVKPSTTTLTLNNNTAVNILHGSSVPVGITVVATPPGTGTPTGDVSLIANSTTDQGVDAFILDSTGSVNSSLNSTSLLPGGTYQVHAHYEGDGTFLGSDSTPPVTVAVTPEASQIHLGIVVTTSTSCSTVTSVPYGSLYVLTVVVADLHTSSTPCAPNESGSSPSGTVSLTDTVGTTPTPLGGGSFKLNSFGEVEDQPIQLSTGSHTITATYQGDPSFSSSGPATIGVTVTKAQTHSSFTTAPSTIGANTAFSMTVLVDTQTSLNPPTGSSGLAPTGTITFTATTKSGLFVPGHRQWPQTTRFIATEVSVMVFCIFLLITASKRRRGLVFLGASMTFAIVIGLGCGSGSSANTTVLGTVTLTALPNGDMNGFAASNATLSNIKLSSSVTITATYSGDANYIASPTPTVTVTVQ
jgi:Pro-kumamolisin, activation domain/Bacterial Ig-like domain (group 3)